MLYQGNLGSVCFYWEDKLLTSAPLSTYKSYEDYESLSNSLIRDGLEKGFDLKIQKLNYKFLLDKLSKLKRYKITKEDESQIGLCILALIKLKEVDKDDVVMIFPKKRKFKRMNKNIR